MYPDFQFLFQELFGVDIPFLGLFKTFGFFVALSFVIAALLLTSELKRKAKEGIFSYTERKTKVGEAPKMSSIISNAILGFLIGFKVVGLFQNAQTAGADPLSYLMSTNGNFLFGIIAATLFAYLKYAEQKKAQLPQPKEEIIREYPHQRIMDIVFIAAAAGFAGAKIFNAFESWDYFIQDPLGSLFSSGGFTFYGGLIVATIALYIYARKKKMSFAHLADAAAPALIMAYAIGRLGCHFSGDGDWGIYNSAYISQSDKSLTTQLDSRPFLDLTKAQPELFKDFREFIEVPHSYFLAPVFLPRWTVAMNYAHNVNREGIVIADEDRHYNRVLPAAVFPTPIYEFFICSLLFLVLWAVRRRFDIPLRLFGLYLIFNGLERFLVEKIRVNYRYDWGFIHPSQAEIISTLLVIAGLFLFFRKSKKDAVLDRRI